MTVVNRSPSAAADTRPGRRFGAARLYRDAASLASSYIVNALFGMAFWAVAAHIVPPERLGVMTAVLAAITTPSLVLAAGIGDAYTALMPAVGADRPAMYRRGQRLYLVVSTVCGLIAGIATVSMLDEVRASGAVLILIVVGTVVVAGLVLQSTTLVAIGRARWMLAVNGAVGALRVGLLVLLALTFRWHSVELAFVISSALVVLTLRPVVSRIIAGSSELPTAALTYRRDWLREFDRFVVRTFAAVALSLGMLMLTPLLVTAVAGPREGALFALSLSIVQTLDFVGTALAVSLVVHASSEPHEADSMARSILVKSLILAIVGALGIVAFAPVVLRALNPAYGQMDATGVIAALCAASVIRTVYMVWSALQRARRSMHALLVMNTVATVVLLTTLPWLTKAHGAFGASVSVLVAQAVLSVGAIGHFVYTRARGSAGAY